MLFTSQRRVQVRRFGACLALSAVIFAAAPAWAAVLTTGFWRLGENDFGAIPGNPIQPVSIEAVNGFHLALQGTGAVNNAFYSADVAPTAATATGSFLSARFDNLIPTEPTYLFIPTEPNSGATDNFGVETWVKAASTTPVNGTQAAILYNGNFGSNGFGLYQVGDQYQGVLGASVNFLGSAPVTGDWVHLALVRDGGLTTFYANGVDMGSTIDIAPLPASPSFSLAALGSGDDPFAGHIDEVRSFTFEAGQFNPSDLLYFVPEPSSLALGILGMLSYGFYALRRRRRA